MNFIKKHGIATLLLLIGFCLLSYYSFVNEYSEGGGDNAYHYFFSKYAFMYPKYFLEHWAKPLFVLLSSPFSQLGIFGTKMFNVIVGISAALITYKFAIELKLKYNWVAIILLLSLPSYFFILQSAMTEPLMSLIVISSLYLFFKEKYMYGAIIMSFSLFSRSEGMFLTAYVLMYMLLIKKWKYIPFLFVGFLIYAFVGLFAGRGFLWYFTENPYGAISQYGHGEWDHFFKKYEYIWGLPQTIALCIGLIFSIIISFIKIKKVNLNELIAEHKFLLLIVAPAVIFFGFHVVVWKYGWCASYGLERVLNCVAPLAALIILYGINYIISEKLPKIIALPFIITFLYFSIQATVKFTTYPLRAYGGEKLMYEACNWFKSHCDSKSIIYYSHPTIMLDLDRNIFDKDLNVEQYDLDPNNIPNKSVPIYVFWDSQFSEFAHRVKLETLQNSKSLKLIFHPKEDYGFNLYVYEVVR